MGRVPKINEEILFRGKKISNSRKSVWVEGLPELNECGKITRIKRIGKRSCISVISEIYPLTLCRCVGKKYMDGELAFEGDIFESQIGGQIMVLRYGTYQAYCPADREYMDSVGFYAECNDYPDMPIGDLSEYALKIGNIFDNPELI